MTKSCFHSILDKQELEYRGKGKRSNSMDSPGPLENTSEDPIWKETGSSSESSSHSSNADPIEEKERLKWEKVMKVIRMIKRNWKLILIAAMSLFILYHKAFLLFYYFYALFYCLTWIAIALFTILRHQYQSIFSDKKSKPKRHRRRSYRYKNADNADAMKETEARIGLCILLCLIVVSTIIYFLSF